MTSTKSIKSNQVKIVVVEVGELAKFHAEIGKYAGEKLAKSAKSG